MQNEQESLSPEEAVELLKYVYLEAWIATPECSKQRPKEIEGIVRGVLHHLTDNRENHSQEKKNSEEQTQQLLKGAFDDALHMNFFSFSPSFLGSVEISF